MTGWPPMRRRRTGPPGSGEAGRRLMECDNVGQADRPHGPAGDCNRGLDGLAARKPTYVD